MPGPYITIFSPENGLPVGSLTLTDLDLLSFFMAAEKKRKKLALSRKGTNITAVIIPDKRVVLIKKNTPVQQKVLFSNNITMHGRAIDIYNPSGNDFYTYDYANFISSDDFNPTQLLRFSTSAFDTGKPEFSRLHEFHAVYQVDNSQFLGYGTDSIVPKYDEGAWNVHNDSANPFMEEFFRTMLNVDTVSWSTYGAHLQDVLNTFQEQQRLSTGYPPIKNLILPIHPDDRDNPYNPVTQPYLANTHELRLDEIFRSSSTFNFHMYNRTLKATFLPVFDNNDKWMSLDWDLFIDILVDIFTEERQYINFSSPYTENEVGNLLIDIEILGGLTTFAPIGNERFPLSGSGTDSFTNYQSAAGNAKLIIYERSATEIKRALLYDQDYNLIVVGFTQEMYSLVPFAQGPGESLITAAQSTSLNLVQIRRQVDRRGQYDISVAAYTDLGGLESPEFYGREVAGQISFNFAANIFFDDNAVGNGNPIENWWYYLDNGIEVFRTSPLRIPYEITVFHPPEVLNQVSFQEQALYIDDAHVGVIPIWGNKFILVGTMKYVDKVGATFESIFYRIDTYVQYLNKDTITTADLIDVYSAERRNIYRQESPTGGISVWDFPTYINSANNFLGRRRINQDIIGASWLKSQANFTATIPSYLGDLPVTSLDPVMTNNWAETVDQIFEDAGTSQLSPTMTVTLINSKGEYVGHCEYRSSDYLANTGMPSGEFSTFRNVCQSFLENTKRIENLYNTHLQNNNTEITEQDLTDYNNLMLNLDYMLTTMQTYNVIEFNNVFSISMLAALFGAQNSGRFISYVVADTTDLTPTIFEGVF